MAIQDAIHLAVWGSLYKATSSFWW